MEKSQQISYEKNQQDGTESDTSRHPSGYGRSIRHRRPKSATKE
jgi:hypothetical protein